MHSTFKPVVAEQLTPTERALFDGLEKVGKGGGRIYKRETAGGPIFFQAQGFWSKMYHFLFSKRISLEDIKGVNQKTSHYLAQPPNPAAAVRVEATFQKVLRSIIKNPSLHLEELTSEQIFSDPAHQKILNNVITKFAAREKRASVTSQADEVLNYNEIYLIKEWEKLPAELRSQFSHQDLLDVENKLKSKTSHVRAAIDTLRNATIPFAITNVQALKQKAQEGKLSSEEIDEIIEAKRMRVKLQNTIGSYLNLENFRSRETGLDRLFELSTLQSEQIDHALLDHYYQKHHTNFNQATDKKSILVEGAGPNGLMTALKLYMAGGKIFLINNRGEDYSRGQILRLDPKWVAELHYYLGREFDQMLKDGWALMKPSGYVEIPTNILEDAIKLRLAPIWSKEDIGEEESKHLTLQYEIEMKGIDPQTKEGAFQALLGKRNGPVTQTQKFDTLIFAGGPRDPLRTQYLSPAIRQTTEKDYIVSVWKRETPDLSIENINKYASKEDFRGTFKGLLNNLTENYLTALKKTGFPQEILTSATFLELQKQAERIKQQEVEYRFFENPRHLYLGLQYPLELSHFLKNIEELKKAERNKEMQAKFDALVKEIDHQLLVEGFNKLGVNIDAKVESGGKEVPSFKEVSTSHFPVSLSTTAVQAQTMESDDSKALVSVAGDALASPHFFSGSGLSSGREGINNLVASIHDVLNGKSLQTAIEEINQKQKSIVDFVLERGKAYTPLLDNKTVQKSSYETTVKIVEDATKKEILPGLNIEKINDDHYILNKGTSTLPFKILPNGKLMCVGKEFIVLSDLISQIGNLLKNAVTIGKKTVKQNVYEGEFIEGKLNGQGKITERDGRVREGKFAEDALNGQGKITNPDGRVLEGKFADDMLNGQGKITNPGGYIREGEFKNNFLHGQGKSTSPSSMDEGIFKYGKLNGQGKMILYFGKKQIIYEGEFQANTLNGQGKITRPDGEIAEGQFKNGKLNGQGKISFPDGSTQEGQFKDGKLVQTT